MTQNIFIIALSLKHALISALCKWFLIIELLLDHLFQRVFPSRTKKNLLKLAGSAHITKSTVECLYAKYVFNVVVFLCLMHLNESEFPYSGHVNAKT